MFESFLESLLYILPFLGVISALVFVHELGHYLVARKYDAGVEVFSIGFGPEILGWTDKNKTRWKLSLIPLGGYVKFLGDSDPSSKPDFEKLKNFSEEDKAKTLMAKSPRERFWISFGGPLANYILTILLFTFLFVVNGKKESDPVIGAVIEGSAANQMGLLPGDRILKITLEKKGEAENTFETVLVDHFRVLQRTINKNPGIPLVLDIERNGQTLSLKGAPEAKKEGNMAIGLLGVTPLLKSYPLHEAFIESLKTTADLSIRTLQAVWSAITGLGSGEGELGGLFTIAKGAHDYAGMGLFVLLEFMAVLSLSLGLINLFPIPILDGGHMVIYVLEMIRGKPLNEKVLDKAFKVGLYMVIALMIYSHWNDIKRYQLIQKVMSFFNI